MNEQERFELHLKGFKDAYKDILSESEIEEKTKEFLAKGKHLPKSNKAILIRYYDFLIDIDSLEHFKVELEKSGIEVGYYNQTGDFYNSVDIPAILIVLNDPIVLQLANSVIYDLLKFVFFKIQDKVYKRITHKDSKDEIADLQLKIRNSNGAHLKISFHGKYTDNELDGLIKKLPELVVQHNNLSIYDKTLRMYYKPNEDKSDWDSADLLEELKKAKEKREQ